MTSDSDNPPATMLQVATAFFHSWLTRAPIATSLFDSTAKTRLPFGDSELIFVVCPANIGGSFPTNAHRFPQHASINDMAFLASSRAEFHVKNLFSLIVHNFFKNFALRQER